MPTKLKGTNVGHTSAAAAASINPSTKEACGSMEATRIYEEDRKHASTGKERSNNNAGHVLLDTALRRWQPAQPQRKNGVSR